MGAECQVLAMYLITSPQSNMIGLYYCPLPYMTHETGLSPEACAKALADLQGVGFCSYDDEAEVVWIHEMARIQLGDTNKRDKQRLGSARQYEAAPLCSHLEAFFDKYSQEFEIKKRKNRPIRSPCQALAKPFEALTKPSDTRDLEEIKYETKTSSGLGKPLHRTSVALDDFQALVANAQLTTTPPSQSERERFSKLYPIGRDELEHAVGRAKQANAIKKPYSYALGVMEDERAKAAKIASGPAPPARVMKPVSKQDQGMIAAFAAVDAYNAKFEK